MMPISPTYPKKRFGQHFLQDKGIVLRSLSALELQPNDTGSWILEIGPGKGALTDELLRAGYRVWAIEIDKTLVKALQMRYAAHKPSPVIYHGNFLNLELNTLPAKPISVIANLPYYLSSPILWRIFHHSSYFTEVVCMLQKEVAMRLCASPNNRRYGLLSVLIQCFYTPVHLFDVPPSAFYPRPKVHSSVITLKPKKEVRLPCARAALAEVTKAAFSQRRKMLKNTLKSWLKPNQSLPDKWAQKRAENLNVHDFIELTCYLGDKGFRHKQDHSDVS